MSFCVKQFGWEFLREYKIYFFVNTLKFYASTIMNREENPGQNSFIRKRYLSFH